jgi:hypothetical protein
MYVHTKIIPRQPTPLLSVLALSLRLLYDSTLLFTYLEILLLLFVMRKNPSTLVPGLLSTVLPLLLHPPRHPTDQVTYLHRRHQQHQSSRLTHLLCIKRRRMICLLLVKLHQKLVAKKMLKKGLFGA